MYGEYTKHLNREAKNPIIYHIAVHKPLLLYQIMSNLYTVLGIYNFGFSIYVGPAHWTSWARSRAATSNTSQLSRTCEVNL